jgi:hypothetical protein
MEKIGRAIVKLRVPILILSILLLIPAGIGYIKTKVNYDILYYLPNDIETMQGQDILMDEFGKGAYATIVVQNMDTKGIARLEEKISNVEHVTDIISYNSLLGSEVPTELIPEKYRSYFENGESGCTMFMIFFDGTTSSDGTMEAIQELRTLADGQCFVSGMSAVVTDTKEITESETIAYVIIAVVLTCIVLALFMDSFLVPLFFMLSIGMAIVYNLGSNIIMGEVSFLTKALAAVLQLAVTMDYSIFLWHSYKEQKEEYPDDHNEAMAHAIGNTITSVVGSSITTVAGFLALCFMTFTLGLDLGIVMAKGVVIGVIGCVTVLPSMILIFDKALEKTMHKELMPARFDRLASFVVNHAWLPIIVFLVLLVPAIYGYNHTNVYYNLTDTFPASTPCSEANTKLEENFEMNSVYMILADSNMSSKNATKLLDELNDVDGVSFALGYNSLTGTTIPDELVPDSLKSQLKGDSHQIIVVASDYKLASDEINNQISVVDAIAKKYDSSSMVIGEGPCTKDLITITDKDFKTVSIVSILAIFVIILFVLKSVSLPVILVAAIEFAIFINMGLPYYLGTTIPFIASVVIGTIQLGATVDYAILMTTRYKKERSEGATKKEAITTALSTSIPSVVVSALGFFAATFGVGMYSQIDMVASLCMLMARGAIISMFVVIFVLPSFFVIFDKIIIHTSRGFIVKNKKDSNSVPQVAYAGGEEH